jgi:hypothetical protein
MCENNKFTKPYQTGTPFVYFVCSSITIASVVFLRLHIHIAQHAIMPTIKPNITDATNIANIVRPISRAATDCMQVI